jgi:hypothetical protein
VSAALPIALIQLLQVLTAAIGAPGITGVIAKVEARLQGRRLLHRLRLRQPHPPRAGLRPAHARRAAPGHDGGNGSDDGSGAPDRANVVPDAAAHLRYASDVMEVVETYLYRPALGFFMTVVTVAERLQSGRLDAYLLYMLIALVAVIAVVPALA